MFLHLCSKRRRCVLQSNEVTKRRQSMYRPLKRMNECHFSAISTARMAVCLLGGGTYGNVFSRCSITRASEQALRMNNYCCWVLRIYARRARVLLMQNTEQIGTLDTLTSSTVLAYRKSWVYDIYVGQRALHWRLPVEKMKSRTQTDVWQWQTDNRLQVIEELVWAYMLCNHCL